MSDESERLAWLLDGFVDKTPGAHEAVVVSVDGLVMASSSSMDRDSADRFAAVASGLVGLSYGAAGRFGGGAVLQVIVEMENAFLLVTGIGAGSLLATVAESSADIGMIAYQMAVMVDRVGEVLTPAVRSSAGSGPSR